jgi:tetratricopeptide (TPR) repeat protein
MTRPWLAVPLGALCLVVAPSPAHAADDLARARALYDAAGDLEQQHRWPEAQAKLREAIAVHENPNLHYALGWALEQGGRAAEAIQEYETAERLAEQSENGEVATLSRQRLAAMRRPPPPPPPPRAAVSPRTMPEPSSSALPWALIASGGALLTTGLVLVGLSEGDARDRDAATARWCAATACSAGATATKPETATSANDRALADAAASRGNTKQAIGYTLGGVGFVAAVVGAVVLVHGVGVRAAAAPGAAGASATVRF